MTASIEVSAHGGAFSVVVREGSDSTVHAVTVPDDYVERLGIDDIDHARIVEASFGFLLERETKESIMRTFDLPVIERYFPEYPDEIRRRLAAR